MLYNTCQLSFHVQPKQPTMLSSLRGLMTVGYSRTGSLDEMSTDFTCLLYALACRLEHEAP